MKKYFDDLKHEIVRVEPYLSGIEHSLITLARNEQEAFYARAVCDDIVHPALLAAHKLLAHSEGDTQLDDSELRNALLCWAQLHRMASEKQFPQDVDWENFLREVGQASVLANDIFYGK